MDPDDGFIANAIQAYCRKERKSTCMNAKTFKFATKLCVTQQLDNQPFVAKHMGTALVSFMLIIVAIVTYLYTVWMLIGVAIVTCWFPVWMLISVAIVTCWFPV